jgi:glutamate-1-semialdehyde 2,1-aminomutase
MSALRLARGVTGKSKVIKFEGCYHGHVDSLLVKAGSGLVTFGNTSSAGVPESFVSETIVVSLNDEHAVRSAFAQFKNEIACVIIEPIPANNGLLLQRKEYLEFLRQICDQENSLLIFDEVISGFRVHFEGAAGYYQIQPDLITYGKIIGGGFPVGAYGGKKEIMSQISPEGNVYQAGTLSGNPVAMTAGKTQIQECLRKDFYTDLEKKTSYLLTGIQEKTKSLQAKYRFFQLGSIFWIAFTSENQISTAEEINPDSMKYFRELHSYLLENGVYLGPSGYEVGFVSQAHSYEDLNKTIEIFSEGLKRVLEN